MQYKQEMVKISGQEIHVPCESNKNNKFKLLLKIKSENSVFDFK
jgi:hypothetical protein